MTEAGWTRECEYCGDVVYMRGCLLCGAPQCCQTCCKEAEAEYRNAKATHTIKGGIAHG